MRGFPIALLVVLAACGATDEGVISETTTTSGDEEPTTSSTRSYPESDLSRSSLDEIVADASERTGVPVASITVTSVEKNEFNDSALGCPEEGVLYTQVITPGYVVLVDAEGEALDYRVEAQSEEFRICE